MFEKEKIDINKNIFLNNKINPFCNECTHCIKNIWDKLKNETAELETKCYPNTYVWIEKFKDDNY